MWLQIMVIVSMYLNRNYSVSHLKFDLMWLKLILCVFFSYHLNMLNTDGSHITVHSLETDGRTGIGGYIIIPHHYRVAGYKNSKNPVS